MTQPEQDKATEQSPPPRQPRRVRFWLFTLFAVVILVPLVLLLGVLLALRSETGTAWVIEQVPGLHVENGRGSLLGRWYANSLSWRGFGVGVHLRSPLVDWSPSCLAELQFCLETLEAESVTIETQQTATEEKTSSPVTLPELQLPIGLAIRSVDVGKTTLNQTLLWNRLTISAESSGSDWTLANLSVRRDSLALTASGWFQTRRDWPLDLNVQLDLPPQQERPWAVDLDLSGSVRDMLLRGQSSGYLAADLSGRLEPLDEALPAQLQIDIPEFLASEALPPTLTLTGTDVVIKGSLAEGFKTNLTAQLPGREGLIDLGLDGVVTTSGVEGIDLRLIGKGTGDASAGRVSVTGELSWEEALSLDAQLVLDAFPWHHLIPDVEPPPVTLDRFTADLLYEDGTYSATFDAAVNGPMGPAELASMIEGDLEQLKLRELKVKSGAGFMGGNASLNFANEVRWQADLNLSQFNPGYWIPQLQASLDGTVTSQGRLPQDAAPDISAQWDLEGQWRSSPAELQGSVRQQDAQITLRNLSVLIGENRVSGSGAWGPQLDGQFAIDLQQPSVLMPGLSGALQGELSVSGTRQRPQGSVNLSGEALGWQDQVSVQRLKVAGTLKEDGKVDAELAAETLKSAGEVLESLDLKLSGSQDRHRLTVNAQHKEATVELAFAGAASEAWTAWEGQLSRGAIDVVSQKQSWRLSEPADLNYSESGALTFGDHCWRWDQASVCAGDQTLLPNQRLDYKIRNFPTAALSPLMPEPLRWDTTLNADIQLDVLPQGPKGAIQVDAGSGKFSVLNGEDWEDFNYDTLTAGATFQPEEATISANVSGPRLGDLNAELSIDPTTKKREVEGNFSVDGLDVAIAAVFAKLEKVQGKLNGSGRITGPLMKPQVIGELALTDGLVSDPSLPLPLEDVVLNVDLQGYAAELDAKWTSNARSKGQLDGTIDWESDPAIDLTLTGERLPFNYDPYAQVELAPDLNIVFRKGDLKVSGEIAVPRGDIEVTALPEQAVSVSEDEVLVDVEPEQPALRSVNMDVKVVVGEDEVNFNGFGVTGDLEGTIRIGDNLDTRGALQLVNGTYKKYGQDLELRRARLVFTGPLSEPYLDVEAIRTVDTVVAGIRLTGPVSEPNTEVFSEPEMPQTDALSYLILGRPPQSQGDENAMRNAAISLGLKQASKVTKGLGEELGIRDLSLQAEGSGNEASVVASGYLTEDLSLRYGVGLFEPITTVALRYDLGRYFYLEAASGLAASLDLFYTRDF